MSDSIGQEVTLVHTESGGDDGTNDTSCHKEVLGNVPKYVTIGYSQPFSNTYCLSMTALQPVDEAVISAHHGAAAQTLTQRSQCMGN